MVAHERGGITEKGLDAVGDGPRDPRGIAIPQAAAYPKRQRRVRPQPTSNEEVRLRVSEGGPGGYEGGSNPPQTTEYRDQRFVSASGAAR